MCYTGGPRCSQQGKQRLNSARKALAKAQESGNPAAIAKAEHRLEAAKNEYHVTKANINHLHSVAEQLSEKAEKETDEKKKATLKRQAEQAQDRARQAQEERQARIDYANGNNVEFTDDHGNKASYSYDTIQNAANAQIAIEKGERYVPGENGTLMEREKSPYVNEQGQWDSERVKQDYEQSIKDKKAAEKNLATKQKALNTLTEQGADTEKVRQAKEDVGKARKELKKANRAYNHCAMLHCAVPQFRAGKIKQDDSALEKKAHVAALSAKSHQFASTPGRFNVIKNRAHLGKQKELPGQKGTYTPVQGWSTNDIHTSDSRQTTSFASRTIVYKSEDGNGYAVTQQVAGRSMNVGSGNTFGMHDRDGGFASPTKTRRGMFNGYVTHEGNKVNTFKTKKEAVAFARKINKTSLNSGKKHLMKSALTSASHTMRRSAVRGNVSIPSVSHAGHNYERHENY